MKTILITGGNGQLGNSLRRLQPDYPQYQFLFTDVEELNICDKAAVEAFVSAHAADYIVNCAAFTAVDKAEDETELCRRINRDAVEYLGIAAQAAGAKVIHVSTDYVFDGNHYMPYNESDPVCPVSVYGETKLEGEKALLAVCPESVVVRTAWLYSEFGANFLKTMLRLGAERDQLNVVFDQVGSPTYAVDLAKALLTIIDAAEAGTFEPGIYHFSNEGVCSWYDFAWQIMQLAGLPAVVSPIESKDFPAKAKRPHYSVLNKAKIKNIYGVTVPHWETGLRACMDAINKMK